MILYHTVLTATLCLLLITSTTTTATAEDTAHKTAQGKPTGKKLDKTTAERGRYLIKIAGCNDCHTAGYADAAGEIPEQDWLTGDTIGWRGPWGTTYATNLRLYMQHLSEEQWIQVSRAVEFRPPMPWFVLREMTEQDLRAVYRFIRNLGPAGELAPSYIPPDQEPPKPYILFPINPGASQ
jgi:mono/diheme cytochrome c family protein